MPLCLRCKNPFTAADGRCTRCLPRARPAPPADLVQMDLWTIVLDELQRGHLTTLSFMAQERPGGIDHGILIPASVLRALLLRCGRSEWPDVDVEPDVDDGLPVLPSDKPETSNEVQS